MKFFSFATSLATLAAVTGMVSAIPTDISDGQVVGHDLDARGKAGIAAGALGFLSTIMKQVAQDNKVSIFLALLPNVNLAFATESRRIYSRDRSSRSRAVPSL